MRTEELDQLLSSRRILVTCGTGGVGKTTLSAALALRAAQLGRRSLVITIDPAKRLATSLGVAQLGDTPFELTEAARQALKRVDATLDLRGTIHAVIPDTRTTFEELVKDLGFKGQEALRLMQNSIFKIFAREFSGTNEYMAMQRLYTLQRSPHFDLIILDTPPSRNTLDFLNAPRLLARFYEDKVFQWLVVPANRLVSGGMRKALGLLERLTGAGFMTQLIDFATSLFEVRSTFTANLAEISDLLRSQKTGFLLVSSPSPSSSKETDLFVQSVKNHHFNFVGTIFNRCLSAIPDLGDQASLEQKPEPQFINQSIKQSIEVLRQLQAREKAAIASFDRPMIIPELARDVHSLDDLWYVAQALGPFTPSF